MLKRIFIIFWTICTISSLQAHEVLKCLGKEELALHKVKEIGPQYKLNQLFVNEFASSSDLIIKKEFRIKICTNKHHPASVMVLKLLLTQGKNIFNISNEFGVDNLRGYKIARINDLLGRIAHIFFIHIANLQIKAPTHDCLRKHIPDINYFEERFHHLEEEFSTKYLLSEKERFHNVFNKLKSLKNIYQLCQRDFEKREKLKIKELNKKK